MKPLLRFLKRFCFALLILFGIYFLLTVILSYAGTRPRSIDCHETEKVYITTNGIHLYIVLPRSGVTPELLADLNIPVGTKYISFGWGDEAFYLNTPTWGEIKPGTTLRALFTKSPSIMQVSHYNGLRNHWQELPICPIQLSALNTFIAESFQRNDRGNISEIKTNFYGSNDHFYPARGSYSIFYTCNNWVNTALKRAKVKTSVWSPFDFGVLYHLPETTATHAKKGK